MSLNLKFLRLHSKNKQTDKQNKKNPHKDTTNLLPPLILWSGANFKQQ